tara:strand:- start:76 stop:447 length:372 start_codon:yes stop_codon:yes gene_type:complete
MSLLNDFKAMANEFVTDTFSEFTDEFAFEENLQSSDGQGGFTDSWSTFAVTRGFIKVDKGNKEILDDHVKSKYMRKFMFEDLPNITTKMRIVYRGQVFNIDKIEPIMDSTVWTNVYAYQDVAT